MFAYFDCFSGISGDMLIGSLLDAGLDLAALRAELAKLPLTGYELQVEKVTKQHLSASQFRVIETQQQRFRHLSDLNRIVDESGLDESIVSRARAIFLKIAGAEARVHGQPLEKVHFHEVGAVDTIIDIVGALVGLKLLDIDRVASSRLNVGSGFIEFSHGKWPVPAPATTEILKGVPIYNTSVEAELVTPTGAAIISSICNRFGPLSDIVPVAIGYGAGERDLPHANVLRVFIGRPQESGVGDEESIDVIEANLDDMNPQFYDYVMARLFEAGARDVVLTHIQMKKNRPGIKLTVLVNPALTPDCSRLLLTETTTLGVRIRRERRMVLERELRRVETSFGEVQVKVVKRPDNRSEMIPEYDDCKRIAAEKKLPLREVYARLTRELDPDK